MRSRILNTVVVADHAKTLTAVFSILLFSTACTNSNSGSKAYKQQDQNGYYVPINTTSGGSGSSGGSSSGDSSSGTTGSDGSDESSGGSDSSSGTDSSSSSSSGSSSTGSSGSDGSDGETPKDPIIQVRGRAVGPYQVVEFSVLAKCTLKVRMTAGIQDRAVAGTNSRPMYSKLAAHIMVKTADKTTPALYNGVFGGEATLSPIYDFSKKLSCTEDAKQYKVRVSGFSNDYLCINFGQYCPHSLINPVHPINFRLSIETDFTEALDAEAN